MNAWRFPALLLAGLIAGLQAAPAAAQVGISPPILEMRLDQPAQVHTLRLHNFEAKDKQVVVSVANWTQGADGNVQLIPPTELSLNRWVIVSPLKFTLKAGGVQTVRVAVRPPVQLAAGEHRAMIYFDEVLPPPTEGERTLRGKFRIGAALYAYQGEPQRVGSIDNLRLEKQRLRATLGSTGNAHARLGGHFAVWRAAAFPGLDASPIKDAKTLPKPELRPEGMVRAEALPGLSVMPGTRRELDLPLENLEPGDYVLEVRPAMSDVGAEPKALRFTVPPARAR